VHIFLCPRLSRLFPISSTLFRVAISSSVLFLYQLVALWQYPGVICGALLGGLVVAFLCSRRFRTGVLQPHQLAAWAFYGRQGSTWDSSFSSFIFWLGVWRLRKGIPRALVSIRTETDGAKKGMGREWKNARRNFGTFLYDIDGCVWECIYEGDGQQWGVEQ